MSYIQSRWDKLARELDSFCRIFEQRKNHCDECVWDTDDNCDYPFYWNNQAETKEFMGCLASQLLQLK